MFRRLNARTGGLRHRGNGGTRVSCKHFVIKRIWGLTVISEVSGAFNTFCVYVFLNTY